MLASCCSKCVESVYTNVFIDEMERELKSHTGKQTDSFPKLLRWLKVGRTEAESWKFNPNLPRGKQGLKC